MATIELSPKDVSLLEIILEGRLSTMRIEINHTDTREFRDELKRQAERVEAILSRLPLADSTDGVPRSTVMPPG